MPEYTHKELAADRIATEKTRQQVASECGVSETTVKRWETGRWTGDKAECRMPSPDDIHRYLKAIGRLERWYDWMRTHYDSCHKMIPQIIPIGDIVYACMLYEKKARDFADLMQQAKDMMMSENIGKIDNIAFKDKLIEAAKEESSALATLIIALKKST